MCVGTCVVRTSITMCIKSLSTPRVKPESGKLDSIRSTCIWSALYVSVLPYRSLGGRKLYPAPAARHTAAPGSVFGRCTRGPPSGARTPGRCSRWSACTRSACVGKAHRCMRLWWRCVRALHGERRPGVRAPDGGPRVHRHSSKDGARSGRMPSRWSRVKLMPALVLPGTPRYVMHDARKEQCCMSPESRTVRRPASNPAYMSSWASS